MDIGKLLEHIAAALHRSSGLDNQSTTTAGYYAGNKTLYLTAQQNRHYQDLLSMEFFKVIQIDETEGRAKTYLLFLRDPEKKAMLMKAKSIPKYDFNEILKTVLKFRVSITDEKEGKEFLAFMDEIVKVKIVLDADLFIRSEHHTGFHGESRIVRYLYIKYLKRATWDELTDPKKETVEQFERDFRDRYQGKLWMGSSQGACLYCASMMTTLGIGHSSLQSFHKDRDEDWRHPLTTTTKATGYAVPLLKGMLPSVAVQGPGWKGPKSV